MELDKLSTGHKALKINLDPTFYGTFAEIGAGQEVARNFFKAGGASGTIAKTMSAYDMIFSDAIYGEEIDKRYVSLSRLHKMLDHEYTLLIERLVGDKYEFKRFFSFANTVTTLNYNKTNEAHGWLGVKFQTQPNESPSEAIMHIKLLDSDAELQQNVLGILGVNLIFACSYFYESPSFFIDSLKENLPIGSVEIDMLSMTGRVFSHLDNRILSLMLVAKGFCKVTCFLPDGSVTQPKDFLYKKNIAILRARFKPISNLNLDMIDHGVEMFKKDYNLENENIQVLGEITLNNLSIKETNIDLQDFLDRAEMLCAMGIPVLISNFAEHYELTSFLNKCKPKKIAIILGVMNLLHIFDQNRYINPISELLLQFGNLFVQNVILYAYPYKPRGSEEVYSSKTLPLAQNVKDLYNFLLQNNLIKDIENFEPKNLSINSAELIEDIKLNRNNWQEKVPPIVVKLIEDKCLFDYPCGLEENRKKLDKSLYRII